MCLYTIFCSESLSKSLSCRNWWSWDPCIAHLSTSSKWLLSRAYEYRARGVARKSQFGRQSEKSHDFRRSYARRASKVDERFCRQIWLGYKYRRSRSWPVERCDAAKCTASKRWWALRSRVCVHGECRIQIDARRW